MRFVEVRAMTHRTLRIFHFSDLHERGARETETWRRRRVLGETWQKNLDDLVADGNPVDIVCFTGDLVQSGNADEYDKVSDFVAATRDRLRVPKDRFFVVPGNHDIDRKVNEKKWKDELRPLLLRMDPKERSDWLALNRAPLRCSAKDIEDLLARQAAYRAWLGAFGLGHLLPDNKLHPNLGYRQSLHIRGADVFIIGLDSAWLCGDDADAGKLLLTEGQVAHLATDNGASLSGFRLALMHHPLSEMADGEKCRSLLAEHVDLVLRGHLHTEELATWVGPGEVLRQVAAGCLYEGHGGNTYKNACHLFDMTLDDQGRPRAYDVRLRGYSDRQRGFWFDDGSLYADAPNGRLKWWGERPSVPPASSRAPETRIFVGRREELARLRETLLRDGDLAPVAIVAVQGMAGVGKSYLAEEFARVHAAHFPGGTKRLVLDYDEKRLAKDIANTLIGNLADQIAVRAPPNQLPAAVRAALRASQALVHVDNVDGAEAAEAAKQLAGWLRGCAVIVTGRYATLGHGPGWVKVPVGVFDIATGLELLDAEVGPAQHVADRQARRALVEALGGLPLALRLAAGYVRVGGYTAKTFLERLQALGLDMDPSDSVGFEHETDPERRNVYKTFALSMKMFSLQVGAADAERFSKGLHALGLAPPAGVGRSLGAAMTGLSDVDFSGMLDAALRLSLLAKEVQDEHERFVMHPLLAWWMCRGVDEDEVTARMGAWFEARLPKRNQGPAWIEVNREAAALEVWLSRVQGDAMVRAERAGSVYAIHNGPYAVWMQFCERALKERTDSMERSGVLFTLATVARRIGDLDRSLEAANEKEATDRARGNERGAAIAASCRADIFYRRGNLDEALRIRQQDELPVYERISDERERAVCLGRIADIFYERGNLDEALRIRQQDELPVYERIGAERERAITLGKLADIFYKRGDIDEALRIYQRDVLPVYERIGDVRSLLIDRWWLATYLLARNAPGDRDEAVRLLNLAHTAAVRMGIPQAEQIRAFQLEHGLPLE